MCGIAGIVDLATSRSESRLREEAEAMAEAIRHRGPDDAGHWVDAASGVALGHRRLAIIDPNPEGHQPMRSACGRYVLAYNGELYNFRTLRRELADYPYRGHSDTEVMLAAFQRWGLRQALDRFAGMFAIALWDGVERTLHLVRDRLGIKPLYYGRSGPVVLFGSELKALRAHPSFDARIDRDATALFLRHNYIPAPHSIYSGVFKLPPGTLLSIPAANPAALQAPQTYWSARDLAESGARKPDTRSEAEAVDHLDALLKTVIREHMESDVPLGAFLSGGIDSSLVVAMMQTQSPQPAKSFTIGFAEQDYDEAPHALKVARHLGTEHTELYVTPQDALEVIPRLPTMYDEPFSDSSQIPTFLVSELVRRHVTVVLSGDGGDELFCGYRRYFVAGKFWNGVGWMPDPLRRAAGMLLRTLTPRRRRFTRYLTLAGLLAEDSRESMYRRFVSHWKAPGDVVIGATEAASAFTDPARRAGIQDFAQQMMFIDLVSYLPDDILVKVDRASMAVSLEARVPILDHRVAEFALRLPVALRGISQSKRLLRQVLDRYVPRPLIERPKMGFAVPMQSWLEGPLRDWAETLLNERRLREDGIFDPVAVRSKWSQFLAGEWSWEHHLWNVLMFQAWMEADRAHPGGAPQLETAGRSPISAAP